MSQQIKKFAILGERCSGTNFLEEAISKNFQIKYTAEFGNKHFFCNNNYESNNSNDILFIGIIRNPIFWLNSFSKDLFHIPQINKKNLQNFLFNEFYSIKEPEKNNNTTNNLLLLNNRLYSKEIINTDDLNYLNGQKYKNIFELRKIKNNFLKNVMPTKVKNYILINYEDLLYNYEIILQLIKEKFNLIQTTEKFEKITKYKKSDINFLRQKDITFPLNIIQLIWKNLDLEQENELGYIPIDINNSFFLHKYKV